MPSNSLPDADLNLPEIKTKSPSCPAGGVHMYAYPHVRFHFYVMIKGMRKASWSFEVSECPSRGYWKQFLVSCLYEHSQNLPVVEKDTVPGGKGSRPHPPPTLVYAFIFML